jgi:L-malate glycosyltransferase
MRLVMLGAANSANTAAWVRGLQSSGHSVEVVTFHPGMLRDTTVHTIRTGALLGKCRYVVATSQVKQLLARLTPDIVIGYYLSSYGVAASLSWRGPLVLAAAGSDLRKLHSPLAVRFVATRGDLFLAWAQHIAQRLERLGVDRSRILTLHRGIDLKTFSPSGPSATRQARYCVSSTRSLKQTYRLDVSMRAVAQLVHEGLDVHYTIMGEGPLRRKLEDLSRELGIGDRVSFPGLQSNQAVAAQLRASDVYISTTSSDGASSSLFEAMGCGALPVVSDIPANREWVMNGDNGLLVDGGSVASVAAALRRALESPEVRQRATRVNLAMARQRLDQRQNLAAMLRRFEQVVVSRRGKV